MEHRWNETDRGKPKYSEKNLSQCHSVHHKSHMDWHGIETGPPQFEGMYCISFQGLRLLYSQDGNMVSHPTRRNLHCHWHENLNYDRTRLNDSKFCWNFGGTGIRLSVRRSKVLFEVYDRLLFRLAHCQPIPLRSMTDCCFGRRTVSLYLHAANDCFLQKPYHFITRRHPSSRCWLRNAGKKPPLNKFERNKVMDRTCSTHFTYKRNTA
jgi:hypothetical protein